MQGAGGRGLEADQNDDEAVAYVSVSTAIREWIAAGTGRSELIAAFARLENICARCAVCMAGLKAAECYAIPEEKLARILGACVGHQSPRDRPVDGDEAGTQVDRGGAPGCAACLGILSGATPVFAESLAGKVWELGYKAESITLFMLSLSVPSSVIIRQHLYCAHVRSQANGATELPKNWKPLPLKEAFQHAVAGTLSRLLGGARQDQISCVDGRGRLKIEAEYRHEESVEMKDVLLGNGNYKHRVRGKAQRGERRGQMQDIENTNAVLAELAKTTPATLLSKFPFPMSAAASAPVLTVRIERDSVFVGGSYCKYSRQVRH